MNDTDELQALINSSGTKLTLPVNAYYVDARGLVLPDYFTLDLSGSVLHSFAGIQSPPYGPKIFQLLNKHNITIINGTLIGDDQPTKTIGIRIDSSKDIKVIGTSFTTLRDAVWVGGNTPSEFIKLIELSTVDLHRNAISLGNANTVKVQDCSFGMFIPGSDPRAGIDVEPNPNESVNDLTVIGNTFSYNRVGCFDQAGKGLPGNRHRIIGNSFINCDLYGLIVNSVNDAVIFDNQVTSQGLALDGTRGGVSINGTKFIANNILFTRNVIDANRPLILAGVKNIRVLDNIMGPGKIQYPGLGVDGKVQVE